MCMFCAAIPATVALGAAAQAKQSAAQRAAESADSDGVTPEAPAKPNRPVVLLTAGAVGLLAVGSAVYHLGMGNPQ